MSIRNILWIILAFWLAGCKQPVQVLVVLGGHDFDTTEFFDALGALEEVEYEAVYHPEALKMLHQDHADAYDVFVFYDFLPDMPEKDSTVFIELISQGKSMLFLHHALCTSQEWDGYMEMVGGRYVMPGFGADSSEFSDYRHDIDMEIGIVDPSHPVTFGMKSFTIHDEGYSNIAVLDGVTPLLTTDHPDSSPVVGWAHLYKQSKIVYLMLGHDRYAYENPAFGQLMRQSIHWLKE